MPKPSRGITTLGIALIRQDILGVNLFDSPYKVIAADVRAAQMVTTLNIELIRRVILGATNRFPGDALWEFVPSNESFADIRGNAEWRDLRPRINVNPVGFSLDDGYNRAWKRCCGNAHGPVGVRYHAVLSRPTSVGSSPDWMGSDSRLPTEFTRTQESHIPVISGNSRAGVFTPHLGNRSEADRPSAGGS